MLRYSVDTYDYGTGTSYRIFDNYVQDYVSGVYSNHDMALEDCDIMNEGEELH